MPVPDHLQTRRLLLRRWQATDAAALQPILEANTAHLRPWIPRRVAEPVSLEQLIERLEGFSAAFDDGRQLRYALFAAEGPTLLGEVSLFPRGASGRVAFDAADHLEIGYWLRRDATGRGFATEAARAMLDLATTLPGMARVTIYCDERNTSSAAVPSRLGFRLAGAIIESAIVPGDPPTPLQIWEYVLDQTEPGT